MRPRQNFLRVFRQCQSLRESLNLVERDAAGIQEIAINAAVVAGQVGQRSQVFGEIAAQIATSGERLAVEIAAARARVNAMSNLTLQALVVDRMAEKYEAALLGVAGDANHSLVDEVHGGLMRRIAETMHELWAHVAPMRTNLKAFDQVFYRLFAVIGVVRVELLELDGPSREAILGLLQALQNRVESAQAVGARVLATVGQVAQHARAMAHEPKEGGELEEVSAA